MSKKRIFYLLLFFLWSCSTSSDDEIKRKNAKVEYIIRQHDSVYHAIEKPQKRKRDPYPFEKDENSIPKITKEFFRCKGSPHHPAIQDKKDPSKLLNDCEGYRHSLPMINGKEGVYPVLLDILNYIQRKTEKRVVITCGHNCPMHSEYSEEPPGSRHMLGAEVDFYVQGLENEPQKVLNLIFQFYKESLAFKKNIEYQQFSKSSQGYANKEIFIRVFQKNEGRNFNNRHLYPYVCIQVRYDRDLKENLVFNQVRAENGILRW
ncbi:MAG: hypothetical protein HZB76_04800 [Chlamydiae bacterium]|nr:hypothetical protein [Chlamydiota bacterium]